MLMRERLSSDIYERLLENPDELTDQVLGDCYIFVNYIAEKHFGGPNAPERDDLIQDVMLKVWKYFDTFRGDSGLANWLSAITENCGYSAGAKTSRWKAQNTSLQGLVEYRHNPDATPETGTTTPRLPNESWVFVDPTSETPYEDVLTRMVVIPALVEAIDALSPIQQASLALYDIQEMRHREVAETLGISEVNSKVSVHRARTNVRESLMQNPDFEDFRTS
jgi:RNA polymerase sigma-70 factor (ECF subfamily)